MSTMVRVRFAPSPTGPLHIGGLRTALFNYLFAKKHNGKFILRIEDTDQKRTVANAEEYILSALKWCGITFDQGPGTESIFGPFRQSERKEIYSKYAQQLIDSGKAYYAFDTSDELNTHRENHQLRGKTFIYNWHNRLKLKNSLSLSSNETALLLQQNQPYVVRFKTPQNSSFIVHDLIRGEIKIDTSTLDDKIIYKSDGMPTYHLANIVDDHLMKISHVIRGEEWLPSLAIHDLLYDALGWQKPLFAHLPLILKPKGSGKLSKRDGEKGGFPVLPLTWGDTPGYRETGYLPESVVNFLALLGWNPGNEKELFTLEELVHSFSLDNVNKSGARFDPDKTKWFNHQWIQLRSNETLATVLEAELVQRGISHKTEDLVQIISLIKERATLTTDFWNLTHYFFENPKTYNEKMAKRKWKEDSPRILSSLMTHLDSLNDFTAIAIEDSIKNWMSSNEFTLPTVMPPLRLAIVGDLKGPNLFTIMAIIGKKETLFRIDNAILTL